MHVPASIIALAAIALGLGLSAAQAATANRTWVSHSGMAANTTATPPCNPQAPCDTFANALTVTAPGGEINCLDDGSYGLVTINQSVTIDCAGQLGAIDVTGFTDGIAVNSATATVTIRNLTINGTGSGSGGSGIRVQAAAAVTIEKCVIQNFNGTGGAGVYAQAPNALQLNVTDTLIANNTVAGFGIVVMPTGAGAIGFVFDRVRLENNAVNAIVANGNSGTGAVKGFVRDSVLTGNGGGINANTDAGNAPVAVSVYRSHLVGNGTGVTSGSAAAVLLSNSTIQANGTALVSQNGGAIFSYGNNDINDNGTFGSTPTVIAQH